jgi:hypothetical protein
MTVPTMPAGARFALYLVGAIATPLIAYLFERGTIGEAEVALFGAYVALVNLLAAANVNNTPPPA